MAKKLTLDETEKCLKAWRELEDKEALEILTICNSGLVAFFAKKYLGKGLHLKNCSQLVMKDY